MLIFFSSASQSLSFFVSIIQTFSAENEGCNGLENEDKEAEPNSNKPLQDDNKSDVPEKEDNDEGNLQSLSGISFY